jgi:hypothetical protein
MKYVLAAAILGAATIPSLCETTTLIRCDDEGVCSQLQWKDGWGSPITIIICPSGGGGGSQEKHPDRHDGCAPASSAIIIRETK